MSIIRVCELKISSHWKVDWEVCTCTWKFQYFLWLLNFYRINWKLTKINLVSLIGNGGNFFSSLIENCENNLKNKIVGGNDVILKFLSKNYKLLSKEYDFRLRKAQEWKLQGTMRVWYIFLNFFTMVLIIMLIFKYFPVYCFEFFLVYTIF